MPTGQQARIEEVPAIYLEDPAQEPQWEKIHLRGVDDLSTDHIRTFANDYFEDATPYVQWVDDTSANLVYKDKNIARQAMLNFIVESDNVTSEEIAQNPFVLRTAKKLVINEGCMLTLRVAMMGDRKRRNAKDASRYYLMHPEADPAERPRKGPARGENGDYKRRRFDDREHRRRRHHDDEEVDPTNDFAASMYDDAPSESKDTTQRGRDLFSRISKPRQRSASPVSHADAIPISDSEDDIDNRRSRRKGYRERDSPPPRRRNNQGRELFGDAPSTRGNGMRSDDPSLLRKQQPPSKPSNMTSYEANQGVARQLRADLKAAQSNSPARSHRRTRAIDSRVEEDLSERFGRKSISLDSSKSVMQTTANSGKELFDRDVNMNGNGNGNGDGGFSIKGSASQGFSIKGRAGGDVKELFPDRFAAGTGTGSGGRSGNKGKELFDQPVRARGPRQKAGDLFE